MKIQDLRFFDSGVEFYDRITIVLPYKWNEDLHACIASCNTGRMFFQHTGAEISSALGKELTFEDLTSQLQTKIKQYLDL